MVYQRTRRGQHVLRRNTRYAVARCLIFVLMAFGWQVCESLGAQDSTTKPVAGVLEVTYAGVTLQRTETEMWFPISQGAIMAVGKGDSVRTDATGRVVITINETAAMLLPNTEVMIDELQQIENEVEIAIQLIAGEFVIESTEQISSTIATELVFLEEPSSSQHQLVSHSDLGTIRLMREGIRSTISANLTTSDGISTDMVNAATPFSPAQLEGQIYGCSGVVMTDQGQRLNSRLGPSTQYARYGLFPNLADVQIMGVIESGSWYRVQYKGGFGWAERLAIVSDSNGDTCPLQTLPDTAFETPTRVINPTETELRLLEPFYGTPDYDPILYQFVDETN